VRFRAPLREEPINYVTTLCNQLLRYWRKAKANDYFKTVANHKQGYTLANTEFTAAEALIQGDVCRFPIRRRREKEVLN
jgi:hypothetical protein